MVNGSGIFLANRMQIFYAACTLLPWNSRSGRGPNEDFVSRVHISDITVYGPCRSYVYHCAVANTGGIKQYADCPILGGPNSDR